MEERKAPNGPMYVGLASQATRAGVEKGETGCGGWPKAQRDSRRTKVFGEFVGGFVRPGHRRKDIRKAKGATWSGCGAGEMILDDQPLRCGAADSVLALALLTLRLAT